MASQYENVFKRSESNRNKIHSPRAEENKKLK